MAIATTVAYQPKIATPPAPNPLGLLQGFLGNGAARTWSGTGFNMIWRPNFNKASGPADFFLELNMTAETLEFSPINGPIPNRGLLQPDINLAGITYLQQIKDSFDNSAQHLEPGLWVNVPTTTNPHEQATVARMGSIPHGVTVNMQGIGLTAPTPQIAPVSITPFHIGQPTNLVHFPEENIAIPSASRTPLNRVPGLTQAELTNPNLFLTNVLAHQTVLSTTVLIVSSDNTLTSGVPSAGGGTDNIAFLTGVGAPPAGGPNAAVPQSQSIFWIERIKGEAGHPDYDQLQYTQRVLLNFNGLSWPHVTVATLR